MKILYRRCAALDVHKKTVCACIRQACGKAEVEVERATFGTYRDDLERLGEWLRQHQVKRVAMESTGVYWIPIWNVLEQSRYRLELLLVELQEERWRLFDALLLAGAVLILAGMTLMVGTITLVVVCLKAERLDVLIALVLLYLAATIICLWRLRVRLKNWAPFSATLGELKKDKACLEEKN